jgi:hypothetical protein
MKIRKIYTPALLQKDRMAGTNNMVTGVLVLVVFGALVYLVDPTFFGILKRSEGFSESGFADAAGMGGNGCPAGQVRNEMGVCEGFQGAPNAVSNGNAMAGQMADPGATNTANVVGNQHAAGSNLKQSAFPAPTEGFADLANMEGPANFGSSQQPAGCYPRDQLTPSELLPKDQNSVWAEQNPMGPGSLKGKNFLSAGALIGVNTVGQSLRNANWQLRSEPPNPQNPVSIFNQSTIQPDTNRRPLEIN